MQRFNGDESLAYGTELICLSPEDIDCDLPWLFWSQDLDKGFIDSVATWGVLQPVLVTQEQKRYVLISGLKRVQACKELNIEVPAVVTAVEGEIDRARAYLHANVHRIHTLTEWVLCTRFFQSRLEEDVFLQFLHQELQGHIPKRGLFGLKKWLRLPCDWDGLLMAGHVPIELASALEVLSAQEMHAVYPFFAKISWSKNKAKKLVTWLFEIRQREQRSLEDLVLATGVLDVLSQDLSPKDCQQKILTILKAWRYPCLKRLEDEFQALQKDVGSLSHWHISQEENMETHGIWLQTFVHNSLESDEALAELQDLILQGRLEPLLNWQDKRLN